MSSRRHFHTFDALRFFAFLKVFLLHLPITAFPIFSYLKGGGGIGVTFFFILSGFLITYIILEEKSQTGKLNLKNFFIRRILRIWPLFYLMILVAFLTPYLISFAGLNSSNEGYQPNWLMSCLFLENYKMMFTHSNPNVSPLGVMWSLCIEEHFYLIWGVALFFLPVKKVPVLLISAFLTGILSRAVYLSQGIIPLDVFSNIDYFAWGALPAYLLITKEKVFTNTIKNTPLWTKIGLMFLTIVYVVIAPNIHYFQKDNLEPLILGILFSSVIMIIIPEDSRIKLSDKNILSYLGIFTYGLYVYHPIVLNLLTKIATIVHLSFDEASGAIIFSLGSLVVTIGVSIASYYLFERQFLKLKKVFYS